MHIASRKNNISNNVVCPHLYPISIPEENTLASSSMILPLSIITMIDHLPDEDVRTHRLGPAFRVFTLAACVGDLSWSRTADARVQCARVLVTHGRHSREDKPVTNSRPLHREYHFVAASPRLAPLLKSWRLYKCRRTPRIHAALSRSCTSASGTNGFRRERWSSSNDGEIGVYGRSTLFVAPWWIAWTFRGWNWTFHVPRRHILLWI